MTRRLRILLVALLSLAACLGSGCYRHHFTVDPDVTGTEVREWQHLYFWGVVSDDPYDLEAACGGAPLASFGSVVSATNALATLFTIGVYAPRTAYARCDAGSGP